MTRVEQKKSQFFPIHILCIQSGTVPPRISKLKQSHRCSIILHFLELLGASWSCWIILHPWYILGRSKTRSSTHRWFYIQTGRFFGPTIPKGKWDHSSWILLKMKIQPVGFTNLQRVIPNQSKLGILAQISHQLIVKVSSPIFHPQNWRIAYRSSLLIHSMFPPKKKQRHTGPKRHAPKKTDVGHLAIFSLPKNSALSAFLASRTCKTE